MKVAPKVYMLSLIQAITFPWLINVTVEKLTRMFYMVWLPKNLQEQGQKSLYLIWLKSTNPGLGPDFSLTHSNQESLKNNRRASLYLWTFQAARAWGSTSCAWCTRCCRCKARSDSSSFPARSGFVCTGPSVRTRGCPSPSPGRPKSAGLEKKRPTFKRPNSNYSFWPFCET